MVEVPQENEWGDSFTMIGPAIPESFANMEPVMNDMILVPRQFVQDVAALAVEDTGPGLMAEAKGLLDAAAVVADERVFLPEEPTDDLLDAMSEELTPVVELGLDIESGQYEECCTISLQDLVRAYKALRQAALSPSPSQSTPRLTVDDATYTFRVNAKRHTAPKRHMSADELLKFTGERRGGFNPVVLYREREGGDLPLDDDDIVDLDGNPDFYTTPRYINDA